VCLGPRRSLPKGPKLPTPRPVEGQTGGRDCSLMFGRKSGALKLTAEPARLVWGVDDMAGTKMGGWLRVMPGVEIEPHRSWLERNCGRSHG